MSDEKPGREDDAVVPDAELTDEQLDRETPGVDDAGELEAAEDEVAAEAGVRGGQGRRHPGAAPTGTHHRRRRRRGRRAHRGARRPDLVAPGRPRPARAPARAPRPSGTAPAAQRKKRSLARFLREVVAELRKVIWPGRRELITYTTVVIVFVAFIVALVAGLDLLFAQGVIAVFG